jgi:DNA-binding NarL/FixJ family response regulator
VIKVAVVDDEELVRSGFAALLNAEPDIEVVGEACDGAEAIALVRRTNPDVVVLDIRMPNVDGIAATRALVADSSVTTKILVLSTFDLDELVFGALQAGASGFLLKDCPPQEFLDAVRLVARGGSVLAPRLTGRLIEHFVTATRATRRSEPTWLSFLTPREVEVLTAIGAGLSNTEIAETLHMSHGTAKTHVGRLLAKLNARDRSQLVIAAYEVGLAPSP